MKFFFINNNIGNLLAQLPQISKLGLPEDISFKLVVWIQLETDVLIKKSVKEVAHCIATDTKHK